MMKITIFRLERSERQNLSKHKVAKRQSVQTMKCPFNPPEKISATSN